MTQDESAHGWSPSLLATLARVFATFVPGSEADAPRRARLAAETLDATADHSELRLLKLAIASLEVPVANLAGAAVWGRFSTLQMRDRERILQAWARHPVPRLRTAHQALKRLALFLAFADDGGTDPPQNSLWQRIGYEPAEKLPGGRGGAHLRAMAVDRDPGTAADLEADVVVVGSGAGGGLVAARLAEAGMSVLVLEAGPFLAEPDLPRGEAAAFRDLYLDRGTTSTVDLGITILAGTGVGGGMTINWTTSLVPPDRLRAEWATNHGLTGFDGPEADADLARLARELDLQPPTVIPPKDRAILDGAAVLGWEAAPNLRNAGPCTDCGACGFGCPFGNKRAGPRGHLAAAVQAGARLIARAVVDRVDWHGAQVAGVSGRLQPETGGGPGRLLTVRARRVVMAAGALRTPLLLQASGVVHPQLGRNLRLHPVVAVGAMLSEPVIAWQGPSQAARSLEWWQPGPASAGIGPAHGGFVIESAPPHPGLLASALPWESGAREMALMDEISHFAPLIAIVRDRGAGRVRWSRGGHPRIEYRVTGPDADTARRALVEMARLGRAAGATRLLAVATPPIWWSEADGNEGFERFLRRAARMSTAPNRVSFFSAHQMGTARSGADPRRHPCDPSGRVRANAAGTVIPSLYVGDASLFPSAPGVNPMLSVMALAERTARAVLADRG